MADETPYQRIFRRNREWVSEVMQTDPEFFSRRASSQRPEFLFIGCADSRVQAELLTGAVPGEMFVHRNVANLVHHADANLLAVVHYAVDVLAVKSIIVCGHYECGGVLAAMSTDRHGLVDYWLRRVQDVMRFHEAELAALPDEAARYRRLVELNAIEQAFALSRTPIVEAAWARGQALTIHAMVYDIRNGILRDLDASYGADGALSGTHIASGVDAYDAWVAVDPENRAP